MTPRLPDGWGRVEGAAYDKLVKRDAVEVPKRYAGEPFQRDSVVLVTDELAGVVGGPGARQSWRVPNPEFTAVWLAEVIDDWIREGGDPYGGSELDAKLERAARERPDEQADLREVEN